MKKNEIRGVYNVTFNNKKATPIKLNSDIDIVEDAVIDTMIMYVKGWHNDKRDKGIGASHLKYHLEQGSKGQISLNELLNLGKSLRQYMSIFKEPYLEDKNKTGRVFEWEDEKGTRFRVTIDSKREAKGEGLIPPLSPSSEVIITFYSDRNLSQKMIFKNPEVAKYYDDKKDDYSAVEEIKQEMANKNYDPLSSKKEAKNRRQ